MKELVDLDEVCSFGWLEKKVEILMMLLVYFYNFVVKTSYSQVHDYLGTISKCLQSNYVILCERWIM
jgi:hypothetical protein